MALEDILRRNEEERRAGIQRRFICSDRGGPPPPAPVNGIEYPMPQTEALLQGEAPGARPGTHDAIIWHDVVARNEYQLPDDMAGWTVLDCGAHIGAFAWACLSRGAAKVVSVEADNANFELLWATFSHFGEHHSAGHCVPLRHAIWRGDEPQALLAFSGYERVGDQPNTGGGYCLPDPAGKISAIPLDALITGLKQVDLLKLDIEGAEWPVLHTTSRLDLVQRIVGEWHDWMAPVYQAHSPVDGVAYSLASLLTLLEQEGFEVTLAPTDAGQGHFFARRKEPAPPTPPAPPEPPFVPVQKSGPRTATRAAPPVRLPVQKTGPARPAPTTRTALIPKKGCCGQK